MPPTDPRKSVGANAHALAKHVTSDAECKRLYGALWHSKYVNGVVDEVISELTTMNRKRTGINNTFIINTLTSKKKKIHLGSIKKG